MLIFANLVTTSFFFKSAKYKITANNIVIDAIEKMERIFRETISINNKPTIGKGIEPIIISLR